MSCPFCDINETGYRTLEEGADYFVMLSNPRLMPGHTLVIPKRHILKPSELTETERNNIFNAVLRWQDKITATFSKGCDIRQNYRPFLNETKTKIDHTHFHLYPRTLDDVYSVTVDKNARTLFEDLSDEERKRITEIYLK